MWLFAFPCLVVGEVVYLMRHPRTFSGLASFFGVVCGGLSYALLSLGKPAELAYLMQVAAVGSYYLIKLNR